jgi:hypothetical protein
VIFVITKKVKKKEEMENNLEIPPLSEEFVFTKDNLLDNLQLLGAWSAFALAEEALEYYFPNEFDEEGGCPSSRSAELLKEVGCPYWEDVIRKFHTEVGYNPPNGVFSSDYVNRY